MHSDQSIVVQTAAGLGETQPHKDFTSVGLIADAIVLTGEMYLSINAERYTYIVNTL